MDTSINEVTITRTSNYHLTRDKIKREIIPSQRGGYANLGYYVLNVDDEL